MATDGRRFHDSTAIMRFADETCTSPERRLYHPTDVALAQEAADLDARFSGAFGAHTRRVAYFYLMQDQELLFDVFKSNCGAAQTRLLRLMWPLAKGAS